MTNNVSGETDGKTPPYPNGSHADNSILHESKPFAPEYAKDFKLERLKFVLQQIDALNNRLYSNIAVYQTIIFGVITAIASIYVASSKLDIGKEIATNAIYAMVALAFLASAFVVVLVIIGILSWRNYRQDEAEIFDDVVQPGYRQAPVLINFWRWHETWLVFFVVLIPCFIALFVRIFVIPSLS